MALIVSVVLAVGACRRDEPVPEPEAPGDPVAAVEGLADALRDGDLVRWSRLSLPPDLHARTEQAWVRRHQLAEPPSPEDAAEYAAVMARLTAPDAEAALMRDLEPKLRQFEGEIAGQWPLMQATMTIFLNAAIQANADLSEGQKSHGTEVAGNLMQWLQPALFTDRERARKAVAVVVRTARKLDVPTLEQARALPMRPALEKGGVALAGLKELMAIYGLDVDRSLDGVKAKVLSTRGDTAKVEVTYPLLDQTHRFELEMVRREGGWYSAQAVREAEADLAELERADAPSDAPAEPAATDAAAADLPEPAATADRAG